MAPDMLLSRADEVARNGAFGKILRPEVFPDAPLQLRLSPKYTPLSFPALPPESPPKMRISREMGGVLFDRLSPEISPETLRPEPADPAHRCRPVAASWRPSPPSSAKRRTAPAPSALSR